MFGPSIQIPRRRRSKGIYCVVIESDGDTSVLRTGGELVEGALDDVETLATAVVEVEPPLKFLDPDYDSINALLGPSAGTCERQISHS